MVLLQFGRFSNKQNRGLGLLEVLPPLLLRAGFIEVFIPPKGWVYGDFDAIERFLFPPSDGFIERFLSPPGLGLLQYRHCSQ